MKWRIEECEAFDVFGIERIFSRDEMGLIPGFWMECNQNGQCDKLIEASGEESPKTGPLLVKGICGYRDDIPNQFSYMLGIYKTEKSKTDGFAIASIPKSTWTVFRSEKIAEFGAAIPMLFDHAFGEWLPTSGYGKANEADLEVYCMDEDGGLYEEVWISVEKHQNGSQN